MKLGGSLARNRKRRRAFGSDPEGPETPEGAEPTRPARTVHPWLMGRNLAGLVAGLALVFFGQPITPIMVASMVFILIGLHMMLAPGSVRRASGSEG